VNGSGTELGISFLESQSERPVCKRRALIHWKKTSQPRASRPPQIVVLNRSYPLVRDAKPVTTGFCAEICWLVAVYEVGAVRANSKARACSGVGSVIL
jgi:hypothetical protein